MDIKALATTATEVGIKIIIALIVMLIAFAIINKIGNSLEKLVTKSGKLDKTIASTLGYVARIALKVLVLLGLISYLGINTAGIATIIASLGVGVGMAVNGAVANFAGGLLILVTRAPYRISASSTRKSSRWTTKSSTYRTAPHPEPRSSTIPRRIPEGSTRSSISPMNPMRTRPSRS